MIRLLNPCLWHWNSFKGDDEDVQTGQDFSCMWQQIQVFLIIVIVLICRCVCGTREEQLLERLWDISCHVCGEWTGDIRTFPAVLAATEPSVLYETCRHFPAMFVVTNLDMLGFLQLCFGQNCIFLMSWLDFWSHVCGDVTSCFWGDHENFQSCLWKQNWIFDWTRCYYIIREHLE